MWLLSPQEQIIFPISYSSLIIWPLWQWFKHGIQIGLIKLESQVKQKEYDISLNEGFIPYFKIEHFSTSFNFFIILGSLLSSNLLYISLILFKAFSFLISIILELVLLSLLLFVYWVSAKKDFFFQFLIISSFSFLGY